MIFWPQPNLRRPALHQAALCCAAALLAAAPPALADVKAGVDAWSRGDYPGAVAQWQGLAETGNPDAQFNLAQAYKLGNGVSADLVKAEQLLRLAAAQGHIQAADTLGLLLFQSGRRDEAMAWLVPSADRGDPRAQYVLGTAYFNGDMVGRDPVRGYALMSRSAASGLDQARNSLAIMDRSLSMEERQQGVALAAELEARAATLQSAQLASAGLGTTAPLRQTRTASAPKQPDPPVKAAPVLKREPVTAGADYAHPVVVTKVPNSAPVKPAPIPSAAPSGDWQVQLGAFSVSGSADALWNKLRGRDVFAGREASMVKGGGLTRLRVGPYASQGEAERACAALSGQPCMAMRR